MKLSDIKKAHSRKPGRILTVPPTVWASGWAKAPRADIVVGLRLISEGDANGATHEANKHAEKLFPLEPWGLDWVDARNNFMLRWLVARAVCDPNDIEKAHESLPMAEDLLQMAITPKGARWLWEEVERYSDEISPMNEPASDDEISTLAAMLLDDGLGGLDSAAESRVRRYLRIVLAELVAVETDEEDLPLPDGFIQPEAML